VQKRFLLSGEKHTAIGIDYCPGGELYMLLRAKNRLPAEHVHFYAVTVLMGLEALHQANIVYRE